eukprot:363702-Chlamydomonas_euryale.AAC.10
MKPQLCPKQPTLAWLLLSPDSDNRAMRSPGASPSSSTNPSAGDSIDEKPRNDCTDTVYPSVRLAGRLFNVGGRDVRWHPCRLVLKLDRARDAVENAHVGERHVRLLHCDEVADLNAEEARARLLLHVRRAVALCSGGRGGLSRSNLGGIRAEWEPWGRVGLSRSNPGRVGATLGGVRAESEPWGRVGLSQSNPGRGLGRVGALGQVRAESEQPRDGVGPSWSKTRDRALQVRQRADVGCVGGPARKRLVQRRDTPQLTGPCLQPALHSQLAFLRMWSCAEQVRNRCRTGAEQVRNGGPTCVTAASKSS